MLCSCLIDAGEYVAVAGNLEEMRRAPPSEAASSTHTAGWTYFRATRKRCVLAVVGEGSDKFGPTSQCLQLSQLHVDMAGNNSYQSDPKHNERMYIKIEYKTIIIFRNRVGIL